MLISGDPCPRKICQNYESFLRIVHVVLERCTVLHMRISILVHKICWNLNEAAHDWFKFEEFCTALSKNLTPNSDKLVKSIQTQTSQNKWGFLLLYQIFHLQSTIIPGKSLMMSNTITLLQQIADGTEHPHSRLQKLTYVVQKVFKIKVLELSRHIALLPTLTPRKQNLLVL